MTDSKINQKALRAGIGYSIGNYLIKAVSFAAVPIFTRLMCPSEYGLFGAFSSYESFLYLAAGLAIHNSFKNARLRYVAADGSQEVYHRFISGAALLILMHFFISLGLTFLFRMPLSALLGLPPAALPLLIIYSFGAAVLSCWYADRNLEYDYAGYLFASGAYGVGSIIFSLIFILTVFRGAPAIGRMAGTALAAALPACLVIASFFRRQSPRDLRSLLPWGIRYSLPMIPGGISQIILAEFDRIMILHMSGADAAGIYSMAFNLFIIGSVAMQSLESVFVPWFYERFRAGARRDILQASRICVILMAAFYGILLLLTPELTLILGGSTYRAALFCALPILCGGYCTFLCVLFTAVEYYYEKTGWNALVTIFCAGCNVVMNLYGIRRFGYMAAGYTTLLSYLLLAGLHLLLAERLTPTRELFPLRSILLSLFFVCGAALLAGALADAMLPRLLCAVLTGVLCLRYEEQSLGLLKRFLKAPKG